MPNRVFRDSCKTSPTLHQLSLPALTLFYSLVLTADDFGFFNADPIVMRSECFPTRSDQLTSAQVGLWRDEMVAAGLIALYRFEDHVYGYFVKWAKYSKPHNTSKRKFPEPKAGMAIPVPTKSQRKSRHLTSLHSTSPHFTPVQSVSLPEVEVEVEVEVEQATPSGGHENPAAGPGKDKPPGALVFESYEAAYKHRYLVVKIPRNREINSQCKALAEKLGAAESVEVARWYVQSNDPWYVKHKHAFGLLVRDAQKLWTEWQLGERVQATNPKTAGNLAAGEAWLRRSGQGHG